MYYRILNSNGIRYIFFTGKESEVDLNDYGSSLDYRRKILCMYTSDNAVKDTVFKNTPIEVFVGGFSLMQFPLGTDYYIQLYAQYKTNAWYFRSSLYGTNNTRTWTSWKNLISES